MKPFQQLVVTSAVYSSLKKIRELIDIGLKGEAEEIIRLAEEDTNEIYFPYSNSPEGLIAAADWYMGAYERNKDRKNKEVIIEKDMAIIPYKAFDIIVYNNSMACYFMSIYGGARRRVYDPCSGNTIEDMKLCIQWIEKQ